MIDMVYCAIRRRVEQVTGLEEEGGGDAWCVEVFSRSARILGVKQTYI
jgi:hypothetical protein